MRGDHLVEAFEDDFSRAASRRLPDFDAAARDVDEAGLPVRSSMTPKPVTLQARIDAEDRGFQAFR